jgi:ACS family glucarate transporter-like MFS transporter
MPFMTRTKVRVTLTVFIFILAAISYLDRTNISIAGVQLMPEFGIGQQELGYILSAFLAGYGLFQIPGGWLAKRFGPRKVLTGGLLWWGFWTCAITVIHPSMAGAFWLIIAVRFLLGVGESVMYPSSNQFTSTWIPTQERGKANGLIFAGTGTGAALTAPFITWLMVTYGWRESFWASAAIGIAAALIWYWYGRDTPEEHPAVNAEEAAYIKAGLTGGSRHAGEIAVPWGRILTSKDVLLNAFAYFAFCWVAFIFLTWFFLYLAQARGVDLKSSAVMSMLPMGMMVVGSIAGGGIADWMSRHWTMRAGRCTFSAITLALTAVLLVVGARAADPMVATVVLAGGAGMLYLSQSAYWALAADFGGPHAGVVSGLVNMTGMIAATLTASVTPWLGIHWGWEWAFYVGAALALAGAAAWLLVDPSHRVHHQEQVQVEG